MTDYWSMNWSEHGGNNNKLMTFIETFDMNLMDQSV